MSELWELVRLEDGARLDVYDSREEAETSHLLRRTGGHYHRQEVAIRGPYRLAGSLTAPLADAWRTGDDLPLSEDPEIEAAFPTRSGRHDLYADAMQLVGARHSKAGLVAMVHWLLLRHDALASVTAALLASQEVTHMTKALSSGALSSKAGAASYERFRALVDAVRERLSPAPVVRGRRP